MIHWTGPPLTSGWLGVAQRLPPQQFVGLVADLLDGLPRCRRRLGDLVRGGPMAPGTAAGEHSADFLGPMIGKGIPQPFPAVLIEPSDLFQDRVERLVGIGGRMPIRLSSRRDRAAHVWRSAALDRGNRGGLLLRRQGGERIELNAVVGDSKRVTQRVSHGRCDAVDTVNCAPSIRSRDAEFTSGGTNAAFATAPAPGRDPHRLRSFIQLGNWPDMAQFVIVSLAGPNLVPLAS